MTRSRSMAARLLIVSAAVLAWPALTQAQPRYDFILVDSFNANPLAGETYLWDINDDGVACGVTTVDNVPGYPGFVWDAAHGKSVIPVASPQGVSNNGLVVGIGDAFDLALQQTFSPPNLPGTYYSPQFGGVNDAGVAVGSISICSCSDSGGVLRIPYVWDAMSGPRTVSVPNARGLSRINESGVAIGWLNGWIMNDGFFVDVETGAYTLLADVFPAELGSGPVTAADINDAGVIVGSRAGVYPVYRYGFAYAPDSGIQILPFPGPGYEQWLRPTGVNNEGTIVGNISTTQASQRAFVYSSSEGVRDLNSAGLVAGVPSGYRLYSAQKINNHGWIVGFGYTAAGKVTGWVLKPRARVADADCNGSVDFFDIDPFVLALFDPAAYAATHCGGDFSAVDCNADGSVNFFDIDPFLDQLFPG